MGQGKRVLNLSHGCLVLGKLSLVLLTDLLDLLNELLLLALDLLLVLLFLFDELLDQLVSVLIHAIEGVFFCHDFESQLADGVLLLLPHACHIVNV